MKSVSSMTVIATVTHERRRRALTITVIDETDFILSKRTAITRRPKRIHLGAQFCQASPNRKVVRGLPLSHRRRLAKRVPKVDFNVGITNRLSAYDKLINDARRTRS